MKLLKVPPGVVSQVWSFFAASPHPLALRPCESMTSITLSRLQIRVVEDPIPASADVLRIFGEAIDNRQLHLDSLVTEASRVHAY